MAQDKSTPFLLTEIGYPLPREQTFDAADQIFSIRCDEAQKSGWGRRQIFVDQFRATSVQETDGQRLRL